MKNEAWIQTYTGKVFKPFAPDPFMVCIEDIAHALSNTCRFGGHCREFYSVSQHSVKVSRIVPTDVALQGLLHDASESYCLDLPKPIKEWLPDYAELERNIWNAVADKFSVPREIHPDVHKADRIALTTEVRDLMAAPPQSWGRWLDGVSPLPAKITPLSPQQAEELFLSRFNELTALEQ